MSAHELRLHRLPLLSPLPLLLLLLDLLHLEVLGQEVGDGGAVNAVGATQRRHHQERSFPPRSAARCGHSAAAPATSDRGAGRSPGGGVFCPRRA